MADTRPFYAGERYDWAPGTTACQNGGTGGRFRICGQAATKDGRAHLKGGWYDTYRCTSNPKHRFGIRTGPDGRKSVIDIPSSKPEFGSDIPF